MDKKKQQKTIETIFKVDLDALSSSLTTEALLIAYGRASQTAIIALQLHLVNGDEFHEMQEYLRDLHRLTLDKIVKSNKTVLNSLFGKNV